MSNIMPGVMWTDANGNDRYTDLPTRLLKDRRNFNTPKTR